VRKRGFEPLRYCYRQPLKLVRLPVSPLPLTDVEIAGSDCRFQTAQFYFGGVAGAGVDEGFVGVGAGVDPVGEGLAGAFAGLGTAVPLITELGPR
jgi:hypothetical protein